MSMSMRKFAMSFAGTVAVGLALVGAAAATAPTTEDIGPVPYSFDVSCAPYGFAFSNQVNGEETLRIVTFHDSAGNATRVVIHDSFRETDRNSVSGKTVSIAANRLDSLDLTTGVRTVAGRSFTLVDRGAGIVVNGSGRAVFDVPFHVSFAAGPLEALFGNPDELVCNALA
jgi:hypothetical protein